MAKKPSKKASNSNPLAASNGPLFDSIKAAAKSQGIDLDKVPEDQLAKPLNTIAVGVLQLKQAHDAATAKA